MRREVNRCITTRVQLSSFSHEKVTRRRLTTNVTRQNRHKMVGLTFKIATESYRLKLYMLQLNTDKRSRQSFPCCNWICEKCADKQRWKDNFPRWRKLRDDTRVGVNIVPSTVADIAFWFAVWLEDMKFRLYTAEEHDASIYHWRGITISSQRRSFLLDITVKESRSDRAGFESIFTRYSNQISLLALHYLKHEIFLVDFDRLGWCFREN